jgi:DNA-binding Lrp family transcriptional regulator
LKPFYLLSLKFTLTGFVIVIFNGADVNCQEKFPDPTLNLILFPRQDNVRCMKKLTPKQNKVAQVIQKDINIVSYPFQEIAISCCLSAGEVLNITKELREQGFIRKFGAILHHQRAGFRKNALVVWSVPSNHIENAGKIFSAYTSVSHCYERNPAFKDKYNLFTMLHSRDEDIMSLIKDMTTATGINDYLILESIQEYKKKSPEYF